MKLQQLKQIALETLTKQQVKAFGDLRKKATWQAAIDSLKVETVTETTEVETKSDSPIRKVCPICSKKLSYSGGMFSKHGYQIKYNQHTMGTCYGSYMAEEGLVEKYIAAMETWLADELKKFPNEWLGLSTMNGRVSKEQPQAYKAYSTARSLQQDIKFYRNLINR